MLCPCMFYDLRNYTIATEDCFLHCIRIIWALYTWFIYNTVSHNFYSIAYTFCILFQHLQSDQCEINLF